MQDLIYNDISRCNDKKCLFSCSCSRFLQIAIDSKKAKPNVSVTNFKGSEKKGFCDYYIN